MLKLSLVSNLLRLGDGAAVDVGEGVSPGISHPNTLLGNIIGESGVVPDTADGLDSSFSNLLTSVGLDVAAPGGIIPNLFNGGQLGTEALTGQVAQTVDGLPLVHETLTTLSPVADVVDTVNGTLVDLANGLSPGASHGGMLVGNIIGNSGIVEDIVDNVKEGSFSGLAGDVYKDVLGVGGILDNLGDGWGTGLESLVHGLGDTETADLSPVLSPIGSLLDQVNGTVGDLAESVVPGSTHGGTLTGNIIGNSGIVEDIATNLEGGNALGAVSDVYDDVFGPGGVIQNLADGWGLGVESALPVVGGILDGVGGSTDGLDGVLGAILGGDGGLLGGGLPVGGLDLPVVGDLLDVGSLGGLLGGLGGLGGLLDA